MPMENMNINLWLSGIRNAETKRLYRDVILAACQNSETELSNMTAKHWINFVNQYIPKQITAGEMSVSTSRVYYYAVCSYLSYYRESHPDFPDLEANGFLTPAEAVMPNTGKLPSAEEISKLLQYAGQMDIQAQLLILLVYESALSLDEIRNLRISDIKETDQGIYYLSIQGKRERQIEIRPDVYEKIENYLLVGGYPIEEYIFCYPRKSMACSPRYIQKKLKELQEPLVERGILKKTYSLSTIRTAAIHRIVTADRADCTDTAHYVGIRPDYVARIQSVSRPDLCELPGNRNKLKLSDLLLEEESGIKENTEKADGGPQS